MRRGGAAPSLRDRPGGRPGVGARRTRPARPAAGRGRRRPTGVAPRARPAAAPACRRAGRRARGGVVAGGALVLAAAPGVARSPDACPSMAVVHDRRPPGLDAGRRRAGLANAGLLHADDGWRAVVLPSLGDVAAGLGAGPGRHPRRRPPRRGRCATAGSRSATCPTAPWPARHDPAPPGGALATRADGALVAAAGAGVGAPGADARREGSPVVVARRRRGAPLVARPPRRRLVQPLGRPAASALGAWPAPLQGPVSISLSADGEPAALGTPFAERRPPPAWCDPRRRAGAPHRRGAGAWPSPRTGTAAGRRRLGPACGSTPPEEDG